MAGFDERAFNLADPAAQLVLQALRAELAVCTPWRYLGPPRAMVFSLANTPTEVLHGLGVVPDGFQRLDADCQVQRTPGKQWTSDLAYLQSDRANAFAVLAFGVYREGALNVQATG